MLSCVYQNRMNKCLFCCLWWAKCFLHVSQFGALRSITTDSHSLTHSLDNVCSGPFMYKAHGKNETWPVLGWTPRGDGKTWETIEGGESTSQICLREDVLAASMRNQQGQEAAFGGKRWQRYEFRLRRWWLSRQEKQLSTSRVMGAARWSARNVGASLEVCWHCGQLKLKMRVENKDEAGI